MWKKILIGTAALALAGSSLVYAQQFGRPDRPRMLQRWQPNAEDIAAFTDARIAAMRAGLKLTAEQERNWPAFETAARNIAKLRAERWASFRNEPRPGNIVEFLQRRSDTATRSAAALKQLSDATGPLYGSLDDGQKRRFGMLARMLRPQRTAWMHRDGFGFRGDGPRGMRRGENFDPGSNRGFERRRFGEGVPGSEGPRGRDRDAAADGDEPSEL